ncbi:unnamed protein product [Mytilus coruscus]|uniref:Uncharacterized protein n=1 Tax=Mytilus coruscus TaxID=42192 RepID=A0A6J8CA75_MYTCO|nr:unnamed protein product [Mytilus coruscus]
MSKFLINPFGTFFIRKKGDNKYKFPEHCIVDIYELAVGTFWKGYYTEFIYHDYNCIINMEERVVLLEKIPVQHSSPDGPPSLQAASNKIGLTWSSAKTTSSHPAMRNSTSSTELPYFTDMDSIEDVCLVGSTATVTLCSSSKISTDLNYTKESATKSETQRVSAHVLSSVNSNSVSLSVTSLSTGINKVTTPTTCHNEASNIPPVKLSLAVLSSSSSTEYITKGRLASPGSSSISSTKHSPIGTLTSIIPSSISSTEHFSSGSLVSVVSSSISSTEPLTITEENIMLSTQTEKSSSPQIVDSNLNKIELCTLKFCPETLPIADATQRETTFEMGTAKRDVEYVSEENENLAQSHVQLDNSQPSTPTSLDSIMSFSLSNNDSNDGSFYMEVDDIDNERSEGKTMGKANKEVNFLLRLRQNSVKTAIQELSRSKFSVDEPIKRTSPNNEKDTDKDQSEETSISTDCNIRFPEIMKQLTCKFPPLPQAEDSYESYDEKQSSETVKRNTSVELKFDERENSTAIKQKNYDINRSPDGTISAEKVKVDVNKIEILSKSRNDNDSQSNVIERVINDACIQRDDEIDHGVGSSENEELSKNQKSKTEHTISFTNPTPVFLFANKNNKKFYQTEINKLVTPKDFENSPDLSLCTDSTDKKDLQTSPGSKTKTISKLNEVSKSLSSTTDVSTNKEKRPNTTEKTTAIKSNSSTSNSVIKIHHTTNPVDPNIVVVRPASVVSSTQTTLVDSAGTQTPCLIGNASVFPTCATSLLKSFVSDSLKICNTDYSVGQSSKRLETSNVTNVMPSSNRPMHSGKYNNNLFRNKNANPEFIVDNSMKSTIAGTIVTLNSCGAQNLKNNDSKPTIAVAGHTKPILSTILSTKPNVATAIPSQVNVSTTVPTKRNVATAVPTKPIVATAVPSQVNESTVVPTKLNVPTAMRTEIKRTLKPMLIPTSLSNQNPNANNVQLFKFELPKVKIVRENDVISRRTVENTTICKQSSMAGNPVYTNVTSSNCQQIRLSTTPSTDTSSTGPYHCQLVKTGTHPRVSFSDVNNDEKVTNPNQNPLVITVYPKNYSMSSVLVPSSKSVPAQTVQGKVLMQTGKSLLESQTVNADVCNLTGQITSSQIRPSNIISSSNISFQNFGKLVSVLPKPVHKQTATVSAESVLEKTREVLQQNLELLKKTSDKPEVFNQTNKNDNTEVVSSQKQMLSTANHLTKCVVKANSPGFTSNPPITTGHLAVPTKEVIVRPPIIVKVINTQSNNSVSILPKAGGLHQLSTTLGKTTFVSPLKTFTVCDALKQSIGFSAARPLKTTTVTKELPEMYIRSNKPAMASVQNNLSKTTLVSQDVHYYVENDSTSEYPRDLLNQQYRSNQSVKLPFTSKDGEVIELSKVNATSQFSVPIIGSRIQGIDTMSRLATSLPMVEKSNTDCKSNCEENTESPGILIDSVFSLRQNDPDTQNGLSREVIRPKVDKEQSRYFAYQFDCNVERANVRLDKEAKEDDRLREPCFVVLKSLNDGSKVESRCSLESKRRQKKSSPVKSGQSQQNAKSLSLQPNAITSAQKNPIVPPISVANKPGRMLPNPINTVAKVDQTITDKQGNKFMMIKLGSKTILIPTINKADKPKAYVLECDPKTPLNEAIKLVTKQHMASFPDKTNTSILSLVSSKPSATVTRQTPNTSSVATSSFAGWTSATTISAHTTFPMNRVKSEPVTTGYGDEKDNVINDDYTVTVKTEPFSGLGERDESKDNDSGPSKNKVARTEVAAKTESASERIKRLRDELKTQEKALEERNFIAQTCDPDGNGRGGDSIYGSERKKKKIYVKCYGKLSQSSETDLGLNLNTESSCQIHPTCTKFTKEEISFTKIGMIVLNILADALYDLSKPDKANLHPRNDCDITLLYKEHRHLNKHIPTNGWGGEWHIIQNTDIAIGDDIERTRHTGMNYNTLPYLKLK